MVNPHFMVKHRGINNNEHDIYIDSHSVPSLRRSRPVSQITQVHQQAPLGHSAGTPA